MESPGDKEPGESINEELERPLLDQFSTKSYSSHEYMSDTNVSEPNFEENPSMTSDATDVTLYASSCPDFECMRGTPVTQPMFKEGHADLIRRTRSFPSVVCIGDTPVTEPMYEEYSTRSSEIARDTYVTLPCDKEPVDSITEELVRPLLDQFSTKNFSSHEYTIDNYVSEPMFEDDQSMTTDATDITLYASSCPDFECMRGTPVTEPRFEEGHADLIRRQYEEYPTLNSEIARDTYVAPPWNHLKLAPQEAPLQTDIGDLESGNKAALQQPPQENTNLSMKRVHGSSPFLPTQRQTENLNMDWCHGSAQPQIENHDVEWGHEPDQQQTQHQTKVDDPARDVIYMVRLLLAMYMIMLPYLGWGHGSGQRQTENHNVAEGDEPDPQHTRRQTKNHDVAGGSEPDPQQTRRQTKVDDPASDAMYIVRSLVIIYNLMLAYLGWGPTNQSPRQKYMILYWVSIGMVAYAIIAVLVVLKMYKMGGAWTWWATFFRYTISLAALIGCIVLLVFVSRH